MKQVFVKNVKDVFNIEHGQRFLVGQDEFFADDIGGGVFELHSKDYCGLIGWAHLTHRDSDNRVAQFRFMPSEDFSGEPVVLPTFDFVLNDVSTKDNDGKEVFDLVCDHPEYQNMHIVLEHRDGHGTWGFYSPEFGQVKFHDTDAEGAKAQARDIIDEVMAGDRYNF